MPTQEKIAAVSDLKQRLVGVKTVLLTEYRGLTVQQISELRKQLRAVSAQYKVVKNRLAKIAISSSELDVLRPQLTGPVALIVSKDDPVAVAKTVSAFARTNQAFTVKGGYVDGRLMPARDSLERGALPIGLAHGVKLTRPVAKARNTTAISRAAAVTIRPVRSSPTATDRVLVAPRSCSSLIRDRRNTS